MYELSLAMADLRCQHVNGKVTVGDVVGQCIGQTGDMLRLPEGNGGQAGRSRGDHALEFRKTGTAVGAALQVSLQICEALGGVAVDARQLLADLDIPDSAVERQITHRELLADERQALHQLPKAAGLRQVRNNDKLPLAAEHAHRAGHGAGRSTKGSVAHR